MTRRLTVVQMLPALDRGGVERGTLEVSAELARRGHRAIVISGGGQLVPELERLGGEHVTMAVGRKHPLTLRWVPRLRHMLAENRVDVLHLRSRLPAWIGWLAWRGMPADARPRLVTTVHGFYSPGRYSAIMTRGERVIAVSRAIRRYILDHYRGVDPSRITVIPRGIDPGDYPHGFRPAPDWLADWRAGHPALQGRRLLTLPGRITRLKGHHDFLWLLAALRGRGLDVHGLIAGGEDPRRARYADELRAAVARAGLAERVSFLGDRADLREILAISSVVLSLSTQPESFGRTALEALSLGVPVAGWDHGGVGEILAALLPAGRCPPGDRAALADTVAGFLASPPAVPPQRRFLLRDMLDRTLDLYREIAG